jgi:hypothetical protein
MSHVSDMTELAANYWHRAASVDFTGSIRRRRQPLSATHGLQ